MEFKVKSLSSTKITIHRESIPPAKTSQKKTGGSKKLKTKPFELRINLDNTSSSGSRKSVSKKSTRKSSCRKSTSSKSASTKSASLQNHVNGVTEHVTVKSENDFVASRDVIVKTEPAWDEGYGVSATSDSSVCNGESSHLEAFPSLATIKSEVDCAFDIENATIVQMNVEPDADIHADIFGYKTEGERGENFEPGLVTVKSEPDEEYPMDVSYIKTEPELDLQSYSQDDMLLDPAVGYTFDHMYYCRVGDNSSVPSNLQAIKTESNQSVDDRTEDNSETETDDDFELEIDLADEILEEVDQDKSEDYVPSSEESDEDDLKERMARSKKWKDDEDLSLPIRFGHVPSGAVKEETGGSGKQNSLETPDAENMCGVCGTVFSTTVECVEHIKSQHQYKGLYACLFCNQVFSVGSDLLQHEMWHREQGMLKSFRCIECGEVFTHLQSLMNHMRMHTGNKVYNCPNCDKVFTQAYTLTMHRRLHTVKRDHVCKECGASFHRPGYLKHHMRKHTGERPFVCKECSKTFSNSSNLSAHIRTHTGEKPYKCSECLASFATSSALTVHRWRHTDNRPFKCEECEKMFTTANTYKRHKLMHVGRKDYQCSVCGKKFSQKSSLTIHMRVHTGHRPFFCTECGATFTQSAHLTVHVRKHTGERPFACKECDKAFPRSEYLLRHKRNVHGHLIPKVNRH